MKTLTLVAILFGVACKSTTEPGFDVSISFNSGIGPISGCRISWGAVAKDPAVAVNYRLQINGIDTASGLFYGSVTQPFDVVAGGNSFSFTWNVSAGTWNKSGGYAVATNTCQIGGYW